ncbi:MAG: tRNA (adenosine(37)-N6)-threonylcarbamoyltransferase complex ATPase subunit type 1 TsaE [Planctomycetaceae bacterium]|nr:tRNA (adenosine(37)-N6)-threonylcarbamoyltransferase complex ATPase subunit type 1 TsaE [Planctomycetaceae bacterium]
MNSWSFPSQSPTDTRRLGELIGTNAQPGTVISLVGNLGAGKTQLSAAIAAGLGIDPAEVSSPTFMLIQEYEGRLPLFHFDTYRLKDIHEFEDLGVEEYFYGDGVCLVEWGDRFPELLPPDLLRIAIDICGETERQFELTSSGPFSDQLLDTLRAEN